MSTTRSRLLWRLDGHVRPVAAHAPSFLRDQGRKGCIIRTKLPGILAIAIGLLSSPAWPQAAIETPIAAGHGQTCALTPARGLMCWGYNNSGQLGDNSTTNRVEPVNVAGLASGLKSVTAGGYHTCALTEAGGMKCWGRNTTGVLGSGPPYTQSLVPVDVLGLGSGVARITAGYQHTCALTTGRGVKCWGYNNRGQLGDGSITNRMTPIDVPGLSSDVIAISAGYEHTCAVTAGGAVKCWGANEEGQLGDGSTTDRWMPVDVSGLGAGVDAVSAGYLHTCALTKGGGVKCWGDGGTVGDGTTLRRTTPVDTSGLANGIRAVETKGAATCALDAAGGVKCWGSNLKGQIGDNTTTPRPAPVGVFGLDFGMAFLAPGLYHTCAMTPGGGVKCWGFNYEGELGDGTKIDRHTPVNVVGFTPELAVPVRSTLGTSCNTTPGAGICGATGKKAVVITHGWNADASTWVRQLAASICVKLGATQSFSDFPKDSINPVCSGSEWDVWIVDWSTSAGPFPGTACGRAVTRGGEVASYFLANHQYGHFHLVAHSAGSNLIDTATRQLKAAGATVHETFLDAYDAHATLKSAGRFIDSLYGAQADWSDNIVDTREVGNDWKDKTDLLLAHAFNFNVTPSQDGCGTFIWPWDEWTCRHSRPYRFYGLSVDPAYVGDATFRSSDPIPGADYADAGFDLSLEGGKSLASLQGDYAKGAECYPGVVCTQIPAPASWQFFRGAVTLSVVQSSTGTTSYVPGTGGRVSDSMSIGTSAFSSPIRGDPVAKGKATTPTEPPSAITLDVTVAQPVSTLRFDWRWAPAGEGLLRIFVNGDVVREIDQRFVPETSLATEAVYIGLGEALPAGTHRLTFRLDGFGTSPSAIELTNVELSFKAITSYTLAVARAGTGQGTVTGATAGIDCGAVCSTAVSPAGIVTLTANAAAGSVFKGWSGGGCTGTGNCVVTMNDATTVTATFTLATDIPRLANISTRMQVLTGDNVLIGGFIIGGNTPKTVAVNARGPSLAPFGINNALANPRLDLYSGQTVIASNDDWGQAPNAATIQASGLSPPDPRESSILTTLAPGPYTAIVNGTGGGTGVGIVEVFEVDHAEVPLLNISTRGLVLTGNDVMIGGFIIQGTAPQTVVVRARGPSLAQFGVTNFLANPVLQLFSGQTVIASNDNWQTAPNAQLIQSTGFAPESPFESAIRITLNPGAYTAIVTGAGGTTGVGIIEVFAQ